MLGAGSQLYAQPSITSVLNLASGDTRLSPGTLATVSGTNFGTSTSIPATVGGQPAAVLAATASQLTIQISFNAALGAGTATAGTSAAFPVTVSAYAPGLFSTILHAATGAALNTASPANPGEAISLFLTGLGATSPAVTAGTVTPATPLSYVVTPPTVTIGGRSVTVLGAVLAPAQIGVYQVNVQLPVDLALGNPAIVVTESGNLSNSVNIPVGPSTPVITGVLSATGIPGSVQSNIESGSWVAIYGSNLSPITGDWTGQIQNGNLPTSLNGVSVTIDGKPAFLYYTSPGQINVQAPDTNPGTVLVVVNNNNVKSAAATAQLQQFAPAMFQWGSSKYAVASRFPDYAYLANPVLGGAFTPAKPGDYVILWCTGFGPTNPSQPAGVVVTGVPVPSYQITVTVGGLPAPVVNAAMTPGDAGLYQVAIQIPLNTPSGDVLVRASVGGSSSPDNVYLYVGGN